MRRPRISWAAFSVDGAKSTYDQATSRFDQAIKGENRAIGAFWIPCGVFLAQKPYEELGLRYASRYATSVPQ